MLLTKLHIPSPGKNLVHRSTLFDRLNEGLNRKLILISATAGFGKSTVTSDWIHQTKIPAAWFSIDRNDNDPVDFLSYVILAIQRINNEFGKNTFELLKSPNPPNSESVINLLINEIIDLDSDFLLVFDDFHLITNKEIISLVAYFLEHMPDNTHVAILTRSDPALPIARLRSQHQLIELRSADLSFTANDISTLFNKRLQIKLSIEDVRLLETKTEGWIAGLQLTALSMPGHDDLSGFIESLKGDNRYIMDYLIEEVLKIQSDDIKEFLLQTSVLEQVSAPLCNAVLNRSDSQSILQELEKNNMFVFPLDTKRQWYRYHHLFADLLKQRLLQKDKSVIEQLHNRACEWYEQNDMYELAIDHALKNNNFEKSIQLIGEAAEGMWKNGLHSALINYGNILPDTLIKKNPDFCLYYSWILITGGQLEKAKPFLISSEYITRNNINNTKLSKDTVKNQKILLGKLAVAFAYLYSHEEHSSKSFEYCEIAMETLSEDNPLWFSWAWFSYGLSYFAIGELLKSEEAFNKAFEYGKLSENIYVIATIAIRMAENEQQLGKYRLAYKRCSDLLDLIKDKGYLQLTKAEWTYAGLYFIMGTTEFSWTEFDKAFENIKTAYNLSKGVKDIYLRVLTLMVYTYTLKELGDSEFNQRVNELDEIIRKEEVPPFLKYSYIALRIYLLMEKNQFEEANKIISENIAHSNETISYSNEVLYITQARLLIAQYKLDEAEELIAKLYPMVFEGGRIERIIELKLLYIQLNHGKGDMKNALKFFFEAMEFAYPENLISYFVFNYEYIKEVVDEGFKLHATTKTNIPKQYIDNIKKALEKRKALKKAHTEVELSSRELDTLKLIAEDLTNQEIADKLFVSLNTVKTHLKNIFLKLDVNNRHKAITKAKQLGVV